MATNTQQSYWPWLQTHNRGTDHGYKHIQQSYLLTMATNTHNSYLLTMATHTHTTEGLTMATNTYNRVTDQGYKQHNRVTDHGYKQHNRGISPTEGNSKQPYRPSSSCISKPLSEYGWPSKESMFLCGCISVFCMCKSVYSDQSMHKAADFLCTPEASTSAFCQTHNSQTKCINKLVIQYQPVC